MIRHRPPTEVLEDLRYALRVMDEMPNLGSKDAVSAMTTEYRHRTNLDGTIDSVCARCYATIGNAHWETDLEQMEAGHICDPEQLAFFAEARRRAAKQPAGFPIIKKVEPINRVR